MAGRTQVDGTVRIVFHPHRASPQPASFAYLRVVPTTPDTEEEHLRNVVADYARQAGLATPEILIDRNLMDTAAFTKLVQLVSRGEPTHVLIPALHHLAHFPSAQLAIKESLEAEGARVHIIYPPTGGPL